MSRARIAVVTSGFPRRSETFALNELLALHRAGALAAVFATKAGDGTQPDPRAAALGVRALPTGTPDEQADELAARLRDRRVTGVHGYFAHEPAAVARLAARRLGVPFGFSAHARDTRKVPARELGERARAAACVIACNADAAREIARAGGAARVLPHGVDVDRFTPQPRPAAGRLELLAVGRLVEKKGFHVLVEAVRGLEAPFRLRIVGAGPERERLARAIERAGLRGRVELTGALPHAGLPAAYAAADAVVVPSVTDASGDRDGLPNVVLEAMAGGRAVVATDVGAITSAVRDGDTGLVVPAGDPIALREALARLAASPGLRDRLGGRARARVERDFELGACTRRLHDVLEAAYA